MTSQSSIIAASLVVAFVVFVTVRGELPAYLSVFTGTSPANGNTPNPTGGRNANNIISVGGGDGGIDIGIGGGGINVTLPGHVAGVDIGAPDLEAYWACMMDPDCKQAR